MRRDKKSRLFILSLVFSAALGASASPAQKALDAAPNSSPECTQIHNELGQLFYIGVYGYRDHNAPGLGLQKEYVDLVKDLNIGGVLPHVDSDDPQIIANASRAIQAAAHAGTSHLPAMIGVDYDRIKAGGATLQVGLGYGCGIIGQYGGQLSNPCFKNVVFLDAYLHKALGLNQSLGPTIERNPHENFLSKDASEIMPLGNEIFNDFHQMGLGVTAKHFPYTPSDYNLHRKTEDTHLSKAEVMGLLESFKESSQSTDFVMTTHLINSNIDSKDMVTFSKKWIDILRNEVGFKGLLVTDGLFMFDRYPASSVSMASNWQGPQFKNTKSIFAARALLAGHDMVFLEGDARSTREVFHDLQGLACSSSPLGQQLKKRIFESFQRVQTYKNKHSRGLSQTIPFDPKMIEKAVGLYKQVQQGEKCDSPEMQKFKEQVALLGIIPIAPPDKLKEIPHCEPSGTFAAVPAITDTRTVLDRINRSEDPKSEILELMKDPIDLDQIGKVCELDEQMRKKVAVTMDELDPALFKTKEGIEAIGCLSTSDSEVRAMISESLRSKDLSIRATAAESLWGLGQLDAKNQTELLKHLYDADMTTRYNVLMALGEGKPILMEARLAIVNLLSSPSQITQKAALESLFHVQDAQGSQLIVNGIIKALSALGPDEKQSAYYLLGHTYISDPQAYEFLLHSLKTADPSSRQSIIYVFGSSYNLSEAQKTRAINEVYSLYLKEKNVYGEAIGNFFGNLKSTDPKIELAEADLLTTHAESAEPWNLVFDLGSRQLNSDTVHALKIITIQAKNPSDRAYAALSLIKTTPGDPVIRDIFLAAFKPGQHDETIQSNMMNAAISNPLLLHDPTLQSEIAGLLGELSRRSSAVLQNALNFLNAGQSKDPAVLSAIQKVSKSHSAP